MKIEYKICYYNGKETSVVSYERYCGGTCLFCDEAKTWLPYDRTAVIKLWDSSRSCDQTKDKLLDLRSS